MARRGSTSIQDVAAKHAEELMALPGVVSVGIGLNSEGIAVIVVGLERATPSTQQSLPAAIDGFEVRAEVVGRYRAQH